MTNKLKEYFPMIRTRKEILEYIEVRPELQEVFESWREERQEELDAWLIFISCDEPERMIELMEKYPQFKAMYQNLYDMCLNVEGVMEMFSKELRELDRNTVQYMIEEQEKELERKKKEIEQKTQENEELKREVEELKEKMKFLMEQLER